MKAIPTAVIIVTENNRVKNARTVFTDGDNTADSMDAEFVEVCKIEAGLRKDWTPENLRDDENAPDMDEGVFTSDSGTTTVSLVNLIH